LAVPTAHGRFKRKGRAIGLSGSDTPFESRWVVSGPATTVPSLAVKAIVVVKVALPVVSF
jgi:hypothetical protein